MENSLTAQLKAALSEEEYIALLEHFAGCRLYICADTKTSRSLPAAIGKVGAEKLESIFGTTTIRVPLDREARIRHYSAKGLCRAAGANRERRPQGVKPLRIDWRDTAGTD